MMHSFPTRGFVSFCLFTAVVVAAAWWWLGRPIVLPPVAADLGPIQCMSYAPFRADQSPLVETTIVARSDIEEDLAKLARLTGCVRTYSIDNGFDQVPAIAGQLGLKVLQGLWLGSDRQKNRRQIDATVALAKQYRDVITGIIVGNEVLLRGELAAEEIAAIIGEVKTATSMPVTYADVWEFWLRNRNLAQAVDFITIHILPYWEDFPIAASEAGAHVDAIRAQVAASFPGKEILIGEVGWPSEGRMREGALPSPSNQARVLAEVMARARAKNYRVNLIEAFDQPWKRQIEGTVGGYWGLFGSTLREPKFAWGQPVSDHPWWAWQLVGGLVMAGAVFAAATMAGSPSLRPAAAANAGIAANREFIGGTAHPPTTLVGVTIIAAAAGITVPWAVANAIIESLGIGGWLRGAALVIVAAAAPVTAAMALAGGIAVPSFARVLGRRQQRPHESVALASGVVLVAVTILAIQTALGLVFDPRYRDLTFASFSAAVIPFVVIAAVGRRRKGTSSRAETIAAATLAGSAIYIALNETFANWQAQWFSAILLIFAVTLWQSRDAQSS
jgi:exo-beta-1,3-glucanase (GH17 family)